MGKTVLTIDDSKTLRMIIAKSLAPFAVKMLEAENGEQGVARAREHIPDVILLDYNMPVMDGYHTLAELKTDPDLKAIPVVMVTTETAKETVIKLLKLGLNDYIAKPFTRELLLKKLNPILGLFIGDEIPQDKAPVAQPRQPAVASVNQAAPVAAAAPVKQAAWGSVPASQAAAAAPVKQTASVAAVAPAKQAAWGSAAPSQAAPASSANQTTAAGAAERKILVVDNEDNSQDLLKEYLNKFSVTVADSRKSAFAAMEQSSYDCLFFNLSMPDIVGFDLVNAFLQNKKNGAGQQEIVGITPRTAQADIDQARRLGIRVLLQKPFSRDDVEKAVELVLSNSKDGRMKMHHLTAYGKIRILDCPPQKSSKFRLVSELLASDIFHEVECLTEEGINNLIITIGENFLSSRVIAQKFVDLVRHAKEISLSVRLVAESRESRDILKQFPEIAGIPTDVTLECALGAIR